MKAILESAYIEKTSIRYFKWAKWYSIRYLQVCSIYSYGISQGILYEVLQGI